MLLKPSVNFVHVLSGTLLLAALVARFLDVFGLIEGTLDLVFWIAVAGWITAGMVMLQEWGWCRMSFSMCKRTLEIRGCAKAGSNLPPPQSKSNRQNVSFSVN